MLPFSAHVMRDGWQATGVLCGQAWGTQAKRLAPSTSTLPPSLTNTRKPKPSKAKRSTPRLGTTSPLKRLCTIAPTSTSSNSTVSTRTTTCAPTTDSWCLGWTRRQVGTAPPTTTSATPPADGIWRATRRRWAKRLCPPTSVANSSRATCLAWTAWATKMRSRCTSWVTFD